MIIQTPESLRFAQEQVRSALATHPLIVYPLKDGFTVIRLDDDPLDASWFKFHNEHLFMVSAGNASDASTVHSQACSIADDYAQLMGERYITHSAVLKILRSVMRERAEQAMTPYRVETVVCSFKQMDIVSAVQHDGSVRHRPYYYIAGLSSEDQDAFRAYLDKRLGRGQACRWNVNGGGEKLLKDIVRQSDRKCALALMVTDGHARPVVCTL